MLQAAQPRAQSAKKKADRSRSRVQIHLHRVRGEMKLISSPEVAELIQCRVILNDLSETGVGLFAEKPLASNQEVDLLIELPQGPMPLRARAVWCHEQTHRGHIVSQPLFGYRIGLQFVFANPDEEKRVAALVQSIGKAPSPATTLPGSAPVQAAAPAETVAAAPDAAPPAAPDPALVASPAVAAEAPAAPVEEPKPPQA